MTPGGGSDLSGATTLSAELPKTKRPEASYAHRSRIDKLGVKRAQRVLVVGVHEVAFRAALQQAGAHIAIRASGEAELVFLEANDRATLKKLPALKKLMTRDGAIWVIRPRGGDAISEGDVMAAGKAAGLVDIKVARFSEAHSALKFVIPIAKR